eukprot:g907.t1
MFLVSSLVHQNKHPVTFNQEHEQGGQMQGTNWNQASSHRTSVIAEAMRYEAVQGKIARDVEETSSSKSTPDASPPAHYIEPAQASVFSAFGKDADKEEIDEFEDTGVSVNNNSLDKSPVNDMTKQCSMIHRMMEMDKRDIDPRDVHKLLPSTMLTSESLELRPNGLLRRLSLGTAAAMDLHSLLEDQALKFVAENEQPRYESDQAEDASSTPIGQEPSSSLMDCPSSPAHELDVTCETPTETRDESVHQIQRQLPLLLSSKTPPVRTQPPVVRSTMESSSSSSSHTNQTKSPNGPVTGWPAAPVLGIMHPMNHTLARVSRTADLVTTHPIVYSTNNNNNNNTTMTMAVDSVSSSSAKLMIGNGTTNTPLIADWQTMEVLLRQHEANQHLLYQSASQSYPGLSYRTMLSASTPPSVSDTSHESSPRNYLSSNEGGVVIEEDKNVQEQSEDSNGKNFKSLEAALAWCHVQHSQKQVPVVPKDDVRKLVDFQLNSGKPIRAPWYRSQNQKLEEEVDRKPVVERRPLIPRPDKPARTTTKNNTTPSGTRSNKKQGTGFFCPPGSPLTRV